MKTTNIDLASLRADYCQSILDNMEEQYVYQYAYQCLEDDYSSYTLNELKEKMKDDIGEDEFNDLINKNSY
jgi:hypothetical protein